MTPPVRSSPSSGKVLPAAMFEAIFFFCDSFPFGSEIRSD